MKVLVHFEHDGGAIKRGSLSALRFARDVAEQTGGAVTGLVLGSDAGDAASDAARYVPVLGADDTALKPAIAGPHARVIADAVTSGGFDVVVGAATSSGKDVLGRVGGLLGGCMASDVVGHEVADGELLFRRPMFAGSAIATVRTSWTRLGRCGRLGVCALGTGVARQPPVRKPRGPPNPST